MKYEFTRRMRKKGWTAGMLASRWGMTRGGISNIAAEPSQRDKDAVNWLPDVRHDPPGLDGMTWADVIDGWDE